MIIDAHHHLWRFDAAQYGWIGREDAVLRRDFVLADLDAECAAAGVDAAITVQARQTLEETTWLLGLARQSPRIAGVVGWVPLSDPSLDDILGRLRGGGGRLVGVRHVVQGESDPAFLLQPDIARGLDLVSRSGLTYDLLIRGHQLGQAIACVDAHPGLRFVLDHAGKPHPDRLDGWTAGIRELSRRPNVWCKLSGLAVEAGPAWSVEGLQRCADVLLATFGPGRLLFGSDWPVCLLATGYRRWLAAVRTLITACSRDEQAAILGGNARTAYALESACM